MIIPAIYLFSLSYSKNFVHGWRQWLILMPLVVLPIYFYLARPLLRVKPLILVLGVTAATSVVLHYLVGFGWISITIKTTVPLSIFHRAEINSWIWWSAALMMILAFPVRHFAQILSLILILGLMHLGQVGLLILLAIAVFSYSFGLLPKTTFNAGLFFIAMPCLVLLGIIFFDVFTKNIFILGDTILNAYRKNDWQQTVLDYGHEAQYSLNQWWKHAINGVGLGDYVDAMWNEYHDHNQHIPAVPAQQIGHMLVSTGLLAFGAIYGIIRYYIHSSPREIVAVVVCLLGLIFFMPFFSQVSTTAFTLALLLIVLASDHR